MVGNDYVHQLHQHKELLKCAIMSQCFCERYSHDKCQNNRETGALNEIVVSPRPCISCQIHINPHNIINPLLSLVPSCGCGNRLYCTKQTKDRQNNSLCHFLSNLETTFVAGNSPSWSLPALFSHIKLLYCFSTPACLTPLCITLSLLTISL